MVMLSLWCIVAIFILCGGSFKILHLKFYITHFDFKTQKNRYDLLIAIDVVIYLLLLPVRVVGWQLLVVYNSIKQIKVLVNSS